MKLTDASVNFAGGDAGLYLYQQKGRPTAVDFGVDLETERMATLPTPKSGPTQKLSQREPDGAVVTEDRPFFSRSPAHFVRATGLASSEGVRWFRINRPAGIGARPGSGAAVHELARRAPHLFGRGI